MKSLITHTHFVTSCPSNKANEGSGGQEKSHGKRTPIRSDNAVYSIQRTAQTNNCVHWQAAFMGTSTCYNFLTDISPGLLQSKKQTSLNMLW